MSRTPRPAGWLPTDASLSDVLLNDLRVDRALPVFLDIAAAGAIEIRQRRSPVLHIVLEGRVSVAADALPQPLQLQAGDSLLVFYGDAHRVGSARGAAMGDPFARRGEVWTDAPPLIRVGNGAPVASLFSSAITLGYISPTAFAYRAAPDFWALRAGGAADNPEERAMPLDAEQLRQACSGQGGAAVAQAFAALHYTHAMRLMSLRTLKGRRFDIRAPNTRRMAQVVREVRAHPERKWTVAALASLVGLSRSAFADAFLAHERVAPLGYVTQVRMERAAQLLRTRALTLHEVARRVGYDNEGSFARAFKRQWGVSPGAFARNAKAGGL